MVEDGTGKRSLLERVVDILCYVGQLTESGRA